MRSIICAACALTLVSVFCDIVSNPDHSTEWTSTTKRPQFGHQNILQVAPTRKVSIITPAPIIIESDQSQEVVTEVSELPDLSEEDFVVSDEISANEDEESINEDELRRQILCPGTTQDFRYDNETNMCYKIETKANCGGSMSFQEDEANSVFGFCDCNFTMTMVPLVFHQISNACYPIYDQAYCSKGKWLTFNEDLEPICSPRTCKRSKSFVYVPLNGSFPCVRLNASSRHCEPEEIVSFAPETVVPICLRNSSLMLPRVLAASSSSCSPGSYRSRTGRCVTGWSWSV